MGGVTQKKQTNSMKLLVSTVVLAALGCAALAQTITNGPEQSVPWDKGHSEMLGSDGTHLFVLHDNDVMTNTRVELQIYDMAGNLANTTDLVPPGSEGVMGDSKLYRKSVFGGGHVLKFSEGWKKAGKMSSYLVQTAGSDGSMSDYTTLVEGPAAGQMRAPNYYPVVSPDGSKLGILTAFGFEKNTNAKVEAAVFDARTLEKIWEKSIDLQIPSQKGKVYEFAIDNNGNAYIHRNAKIEKKVFEQLIYTTDGKRVKKLQVAKDRAYMNASIFGHDAAGNVVFAGLCGPKNAKRYDAVFFAHFDSGSREMTGSKTTDSPTIAKPGTSSSGQYEVKLIDIVAMDGATVVLAEEQFRAMKSVEGAPGTYNYTYEKGRVLLMGFDNSGSRLWENTIDKASTIRTTEYDPGFDGFGYGVVGGKLHLVYNILDIRFPFTDNDGRTYRMREEFGAYATQPAFLEVLDAKGAKQHAQLKYGKPLVSLTYTNTSYMGLYPGAVVATPAGLAYMQRSKAPGKCRVGIVAP